MPHASTRSWLLAGAVALTTTGLALADGPATQPTGGPTLKTSATMPAGHPAPAAGGSHAGGGGMSKRPTSGALRVLVTQGTKGGPAIGAEAATVELLAKGQVIKTYQTKLSDKGVLELTDLPIDKAFQPVVTINHAGGEQQLVGPPIHIFQPAVEVDMKLYEVTQEKPAWTIGLRQASATIEKKDGILGLRVQELLGVTNPTDKAWAGETNAKNERQIMAITLPANASDVLFGPGMAEAGAKVQDGAIVRGKTMLPGAHEYIFAYFIPVKEGKATVTFTAPADTTLFAAYLPSGVKIGTVTGAELGTSAGTHGDAKDQLVRGRKLKSGSTVVIELRDIQEPKPATSSAPATQK